MNLMSQFFMNMDFTTFLFINVIFVVLLIILFFNGKSVKPSKLNLSGKKKLGSQDIPHKQEDMRSLTVYFKYNGETKEAYHILGLPAGAPLEMAETAYQKLIQEKTQVDDLYLNAIEALRKTHQN